jgi:hypothetical protein
LASFRRSMAISFLAATSSAISSEADNSSFIYAHHGMME